jgi:uncharacterized protein YukE
MAGQSISYAAFQQFENTIGQVSGELSTNLKNLANAIATVQAAWVGEGASAFTRAQIALNDDHDALRRLIDGIHEAVITTRNLGSGNDADVLSSFRSIDVNGDAAGGHLGANSTQTGISAGLDSKISGY